MDPMSTRGLFDMIWEVHPGVNIFNLAGRLTDNPATEGPTYPTQSACWYCGTVVIGSPTIGARHCSNGHDLVSWMEHLPGTAWEQPKGNVRTLETSCP